MASSPGENYFIYYLDKPDSYAVQNIRTQTSRTILQLALEEIASYDKLSLKSTTDLHTPPPESIADTPSISNDPSVQNVQKEEYIIKPSYKSPVRKPKKIESSSKQEFKNEKNLETCVLFDRKKKEISVENSIKKEQDNIKEGLKEQEIDLNLYDIMNKLIDEDIVSIPQLSRFVITNIKLKIIPKPYSEYEVSPPPSSPIETETVACHNVCTKSVQNEIDEEVQINTIDYTSDVEYNQLNEIVNLVANIKSSEWNTALEALQEITNLSLCHPPETFLPHMPEINQSLIQLLQSPRSAVCRTCCQLAGTLFKTISDVSRPEFDDIVNILLVKTADLNRFIKNNANVALDAMVNNVAPFHAIRAICTKGAKHKNDLVRVASSRLLVQIISNCGQQFILGHNANEFTRKRILTSMLNFRTDKSTQVRQNGEKMYSILHVHPNFETYVKKMSDIRLSTRRKIEL